MKITIEHYDNKYICETLDETDANELLDLMCRFMVVIGYQPKSVENAIVNKYHLLPKED